MNVSRFMCGIYVDMYVEIIDKFANTHTTHNMILHCKLSHRRREINEFVQSSGMCNIEHTFTLHKNIYYIVYSMYMYEKETKLLAHESLIDLSE